ncbi:MAG: diaminobutyrate-2-oxoglutarate aminotransferase [Candidatus Latescibacteria bacterium]|jgi:elongation factor P hydroxylase|nr:diaminobutyrate-2-oxoglutarate aminotransferase [Candidatus Latescibacterota bacterium]
MDLQTFTCILNKHFLHRYGTILTGGHEEPFYRARSNDLSANIQFTRDYIRSAMHELAHWCLAGKKRRLQDDFGYWYLEDGRTQIQQEAFFKVEVKPQAIEWAFATVCDVPFEVSVDNLENHVSGSLIFQDMVHLQISEYLDSGYPRRAQEILALLHDYRDGNSDTLSSFLRDASPQA